jgi:glycosyltransferase involved in cell wall biosynthesis
VLVHTYHGHSLSGYFSDRTAALYRSIEQVLGRHTDRLIAVSDEVRNELVAMGVAPASKFGVVPLGFDLEPFTVSDPERSRARDTLRAELGIPADALVVTLVARLVPIKRVDRFLRVARALGDPHFLVIGDGELREGLQRSPDAFALGNRLIWTGFRRNIAAVCFASDVVVQTSDNEGTPVALIEAQAAGLAVVSTRVGGTPTAVIDGETGWLIEPNDVEGFVSRVAALLQDPDARARMGAEGRRRALERFALAGLVDRIDDLYRGLYERG